MTMRSLIAANQKPDTAADIAARKKWIAAGQQAHADALVKFGAVTADNARDFISYQEQRERELWSAQ